MDVVIAGMAGIAVMAVIAAIAVMQRGCGGTACVVKGIELDEAG